MNTAEVSSPAAEQALGSLVDRSGAEEALDAIYRTWLEYTNVDDEFLESELAALVVAARQETDTTACATASSLLDGFVALIATEYLDDKTDVARLCALGRGAVQNYFQGLKTNYKEPNLDEATDAIKTVYELATAQKFVFGDIIWKEDGKLYAQAQRPRHLKLVKLLFAHGGTPVIKIHNNYSENMPLKYRFVDDVLVEFMPHWEDDVYEVEGRKLKLPEVPEVLVEDLEAARQNRITPGSLEAYIVSKQRQYKE